MCRGGLAYAWVCASPRLFCVAVSVALGSLRLSAAFVAVLSIACFTVRLSLLLEHSNSGGFLKYLKAFFFFSFLVQNLLTSSILKMPVSEEEGSFHKAFAVPRNRPLASPLQVTKHTLCMYVC